MSAPDSETLERLLAASTPGQWDCHYVRDDVTCDCKSVIGDHGGMCAICVIHVDNGLDISEVGNDAPDETQARANARLIAASPDMGRELLAARAEVERLRAQISKDAALFDRCATNMAESFGMSGTRRSEATIYAQYCRDEARAALENQHG